MNIEQKTFMLCFIAVIWKRIFCTMIVYSDLKKIALNSNNILKCLKYNLLAPVGLVNMIKPYIIKALLNGFLMPQEYKSNTYVKNAINLFGDAYKIYKRDVNVKEEEMKFISSYISTVFNDKQEMIDCMNDDLCDLIDVWDVELGLVASDPYIDLIKFHLFSVLY